MCATTAKKTVKLFDVCRSDNKPTVIDEHHDEHGLRKLSLLVFRTRTPPSNDAISDHKTELNLQVLSSLSLAFGLSCPYGGSGMIMNEL